MQFPLLVTPLLALNKFPHYHQLKMYHSKAHSGGAMKFTALPNELYIMIAEHMKPRDLLSFMRTSHFFAELLTPDFDRMAIRHKMRWGRTVLHWAAEEGKKGLAERLLRRGFEVNCADSEGETPLHFAARSGHADFAELLLSWGASIGHFGSPGFTPLRWAALHGHVPVVKLLLNQGADATCDSLYPNAILEGAIGHFLSFQEKGMEDRRNRSSSDTRCS